MSCKPTLLFIAFFVSGVVLLKGEDGPPKGPPPSPIKVGKVEEGSIQNRKVVTGKVVATTRTSLSPQVGGSVIEVMVEKGTIVKKGQPLLKLDDRRALQDLKVNQQLQLVNASQIESNQSVLTLQKEDLNEIENALTSFPGSISQKELREAQITLAKLEGDLETLKAESNRLKAQENRLKIDLQDHILFAPFSGVVLEKLIEVGSQVVVGQRVFTLINPKKLQVELDCPESMANVDPSILGDSHVTLSVHQTVLKLFDYRIAPSLDPKSKTFKVIANLREIPPGAIDGASVTGEVAVGATTKRLWLPGDAILKNEVGPYVYKVQKSPMGDIALPTPVQILYRVGSQTIIAPGSLLPGDQVITEGNERLFPNMPVKVMEENK